MVTSLEELYWSLRNDAQKQAVARAHISGQLKTTLPVGTDFSSPAFSYLEHPWFYEFVSHPQISSLLRDTLRYLFLYFTYSTSTLPDHSLTDLVCNRCIEILETHYQAHDQEVAAFRRFWDLLIINPKLVNFKTDSTLISFTNFRQVLTQSTQQQAVKNIRQKTAQEFIPRNPAYETIRQRYQDQLSTYYQKGFIYLLGEFDFNDFYIPPQLRKETLDSLRTSQAMLSYIDRGEAWQGIFDARNFIYVIGSPGSGKSLFLRNLINHYYNMSFPGSKDYLVIYCDMKTYYTTGDGNPKSILRFFQETIINTTGMDETEISPSFIRYYLQMGRCLILMDALDEVPKTNRLALHKMVVSYFKGVNPDNKLCITSRARGFLPQSRIEVLRIPNLTKQDISSYLDKMIALDRFKAKDKEPFLAQAQILIQKDFLTNFLTLSLMVNIYKAERKLPETKIELYKKCFEYIAKKREMEKGGKVSYDWDLLAPLMKESTFISLSILAAPNNQEISRESIEEMLLDQYRYKYTDEAKTESAIWQFLDFCSSRTDLFVLGDSEETFRFFHRSFFEYFYSRYITQQSQVEKMYRLMSKFDEDSEVFELTLALIKEDNDYQYQKLVNCIFEKVENEFQLSRPRYTAFKILTLSMQVIDDFSFCQKYIRLLTEYVDLLTSPAGKKLNQDAITYAADKILPKFPEDALQFHQVYQPFYVAYMMQEIAQLPSEVSDSLLSSPKQETDNMVPVFHWGGFYVPQFYVSAYPEADKLRDEVIHWGDAECNRLLSTVENHKEYANIRKGLVYFLSLPLEDRKKIWDLVTKQIESNNSPFWDLDDLENIFLPDDEL